MTRKSRREIEQKLERFEPTADSSALETGFTDGEREMFGDVLSDALGRLSDDEVERADTLADTVIEESIEGDRDLLECGAFHELTSLLFKV